MRIRTIKPELLLDERVARLPDRAFRLFIGTILLADDYGRLHGAIGQLRGQVFWGADVNCNVHDVSHALANLLRENLILAYQVDGQRYLLVRSWSKHQKVDHPGKPRVPPPSDSIDDPVGLAKLSRESLEYAESLAPDLGPRILGPRTLDLGTCEDLNSRESRESRKSRESLAKVRKTKAPAGEPDGSPRAQGELALTSAEDKPTVRVWSAYAEAYQRRYGTAPVRNARVNGQLAQLVARLGAEEAREVAGWYVAHPAAFYAAKGHPIGLLLANAETLRTEWATSAPILPRATQSAEKTAANPALALADRLRRQGAGGD